VTLMPVELQDRFNLDKARVFLNGTQALIRLCLMQSELDRRAGLRTAGYVTGYRGSPLGGLDQQFPRAKAELDAVDVVFEPALNEDLAATAIWGAQQAELRGEGRFDGVFCMWYGKGPGVDRSGDVFRHANLAGTSAHGGAIALMGDDHTCESSTTAHQSEFALMDAMIPVLNPANIHEIIEYGLHAWALSRYAGVWCGLKCVKDNIESTASVDAGLDQFSQIIPQDGQLPAEGLNIRTHDHPAVQEARLHQHKQKAVLAYARANQLDRIIIRAGAQAKLGIVSTGKSYMDTLQALEELGIDENNGADYGLSLYKVAMPWPLEPEGIREFAEGLELIIVVEEKRGLIEEQLKSILYGSANPPTIIGKQDENSQTLFQAEAALNPVQISAAIAERLARFNPPAEIHTQSGQLNDRLNQERAVLAIERKPYFCAGCPHNSSTVIPQGARAYAGIGCHWMVQFMDRSTEGYTHMGGEGANWIGESRFSNREHIFQNIGDGTFNHSGLMAIRAAIASNTHMTFKLLYNDAVAMTGGQLNDGGLTMYDIVRMVVAAGAAKTSVVSDQPEKIEKGLLPNGVLVDHRDNIIRVQKNLAAKTGVTVLIYEQTCASEKRRRRKRGTMPESPKRVFINDAVCEGCGDCGVQSNCVAIVPLETELGRKRQIDQSTCNMDLSCVNGFCPSFVTITGGQLRQPEIRQEPIPSPPEPASKADLHGCYAIALTGIGGSGVVTVGAILGMAAHVEGRGCGIVDMAGLAQKGGAVVSHIKLAPAPEDITAIRIAPGGADLLLGCDLLVSSSEPTIKILNTQNCRAVVNTYQKMPGAFTKEPDLNLPVNLMQQRLVASLGEDAVSFVDATDIAAKLLGDSIAANMFVLGVAYQKGWIPLSIEALNKAIELNGVAVEFNQSALQWGRLWVADSAMVEQRSNQLGSSNDNTEPQTDTGQSELTRIIEHRVDLLTHYQNPAYAQAFRHLVERVNSVDPDAQKRLTMAVARGASKLRAYKDEYEVSRLYASEEFTNKLAAQFVGDFRVSVQLAPPLLARRDPVSGKVRKREFGKWIFRLFPQLAKLKILRGTVVDPFGWTHERKAERRLIVDYEALIGKIAGSIDEVNYGVAVELAELPQSIRGFGHVKMHNIEQFAVRQDQLLRSLYTSPGKPDDPDPGAGSEKQSAVA